MIISLFRKSPISLITSLSFFQGDISNALYLWVRRTLVIFLFPDHSVRQFQLSKKQKKAVFRRWKHMKTKKTTDKSIFPVPKQEQENAQTAIIVVSEAVQITKLYQRKDAPTHTYIQTNNLAVCTASWLYVLQASARQERRGLKTIGFSAFSKY